MKYRVEVSAAGSYVSLPNSVIDYMQYICSMAPSMALIATASASAGIIVGFMLRSFFRRPAAVLRSRASSIASDDGDWSDTEEVGSKALA